MYENLEAFEEKFKSLEQDLMDVNIISDSKKYQKTAIEHAEIEPIVLKYREYKTLVNTIKDNKDMLRDNIEDDLKDLVKEELKEAEDRLEVVEEELRILLIPKDPNDNKNVIMEIRAGAGGDEAALFAGVLYRQYVRYAERQGWKTDIMNTNEIGIGGYKEVVFMIIGKGAYSRLKYESGVHRVQRVPETESSGRIHTSTATVAVLPEVEDVEVEIDPTEIKFDVFRASGNGGQCVNTTDSAVRLTHIPTGLVISCQDEKSQLKNKEKALKVLKTKLYDLKMREQQGELSDQRSAQIGTGDRSERIRTYNYPQGRVTDHRISLTLHKIDQIVDGDIDEIIDALTSADQAANINKA
ncbi:peptide chain release factor 1 [Peptoniphilus asaccharolyticus DSM 20463]|uniref:Peptide chain release factor 1 n=1 Tax=Peptoniphilus asaccharolyticus DSM 20463 TaxID=573058 RepID=A0A1W1UPQ8_PEPAS|nr:peptide chain release factor 1 [Peptoniphilus asaccharolyticus]MBL7575007.1 peptide chain release factor 1 [Peptoniphilus asaccharolyticus]SMB83115.1 peptide chain release factor 1 [Peptoniphilus asaccharolyticus DSM 20463]